MFNIAKWFTGIIFALIQVEKNLLQIMADCNAATTVHGKKYLDCVGKTSNFPKGLGKDVEILNISENNILDKVTDKSFEEFKQLKELIMTRMEGIIMDEKALESLKELETLDISGTSLGGSSITLPSSIKRLLAAETPATSGHLRMEDLENLRELHLSMNNFRNMPKIPKEAPLIHLDLSYNPMNELDYMSIASFCLLNHVNLEGTGLSNESKYHHRCCGVLFWLQNKTSVSTKSLKCVSCEKVEMEFDSDALAAYDECVNTGDSKRNMMFLQALVVVVLILAISYLIYKYYQSRAVREFRESRKVGNLPPLQYATDEKDEKDEKEDAEEAADEEDQK